MTDWTDESPFCFKAYFPFLDSHPNLLMHLCPLGHWTRTHYSNCGNGNFRCSETVTSYLVAASAWMFKQGMGTSLLPIKSLRNSWSAACHCGLQAVPSWLFFFQVTSFTLFSTIYICCKYMLSTSSTGSSFSPALHLARPPMSLFLDHTRCCTSSLVHKDIRCQKIYHVSLTDLCL